MTNLLIYGNLAQTVRNRIREKELSAESSRETWYRAATKIQSVYKSFAVRTYLTKLHKAATVIQKSWRGFSDRRKYQALLKDKVRIPYERYYRDAAIKIQKTWRGYISRKNSYDYYTRKRYLEKVVTIGNTTTERLAEYGRALDEKAMRDDIEKTLQQFEELSLKCHHMKSTKHLQGFAPRLIPLDDRSFTTRIVIEKCALNAS